MPDFTLKFGATYEQISYAVGATGAVKTFNIYMYSIYISNLHKYYFYVITAAVNLLIFTQVLAYSSEVRLVALSLITFHDTCW